MMKSLVAFAATLLFATACASAMTLTSNDFTNGATIPQKFTCSGQNLTPELSFGGIPAKAKALALTMHDPDAPRPGGFTHWTVYHIPLNATSLNDLSRVTQGPNGRGDNAYTGPCPPPGKPHHYIFTLYALDADLAFTKDTSYETFNAMIRGHVIDKTQLVGLFGR